MSDQIKPLTEEEIVQVRRGELHPHQLDFLATIDARDLEIAAVTAERDEQAAELDQIAQYAKRYDPTSHSVYSTLDKLKARKSATFNSVPPGPSAREHAEHICKTLGVDDETCRLSGLETYIETYMRD